MATKTLSDCVCTANHDNRIDDYALSRINFRVRRLTCQFDLSEDEQGDYRQDMMVELLSAFERFDPSKATRETFINRVLDRFVKYAIRARFTRLRRTCDSPLGFEDVSIGFEPVVNEARAGEKDEQARRELRLDMAVVMARMPARLRRMCRLLMKFGATETARKLGICRQSIYRNFAEIREYMIGAGLVEIENSATKTARLQM